VIPAVLPVTEAYETRSLSAANTDDELPTVNKSKQLTVATEIRDRIQGFSTSLPQFFSSEQQFNLSHH